MKVIGVISDTHGLLRPEAVQALSNVDFILHAGDIGSPRILEDLQRLAPVTAVRGNVDQGDWASDLPLTASIVIEGVTLYLIHDVADLAQHPPSQETRVIIYGHSHKPSLRDEDSRFYLNPGSAGRRRFSLPITLAIGYVLDSNPHFSLVDLTASPLANSSAIHL